MDGIPAAASDDVERLFRRLVANLAALDPSRLALPFPVADIPRSLVPYRTHRLALRFETSEDYEMAVLRLLAGEGGYAVVEPEATAAAFAQEVVSPSPDPTIVRQHGAAKVHLDPECVAHALGRPLHVPAPPSDEEPPVAPDPAVRSIFGRKKDAPAGRAAQPGAGAEAGAGEPRFTLDEEPETPPFRGGRTGSSCAYCGGELPIGRVVLFCPHCGQNVGVVHCPTCGSELDVGWQFCIACGQKVGGDFT